MLVEGCFPSGAEEKCVERFPPDYALGTRNYGKTLKRLP